MTDDAPSNPTPPDNSSFVEHLRLVHFTLIAACLILCIAVTSQRPSSATRAYEQATQLRRIQTIWHQGDWLVDFVAQRQAKITKGMHLPPYVELELADPHAAVDNFDQGSRQVIASPNWPNWWLFINTLSSSTFTDYGAHLNDNLADIIWIWDRLNESETLLIPTAVHGGWAIGSDNIAEIKDGMTPIESASSGANTLEISTRPGIILKYKNARLNPLSQKIYNLVSTNKNIQCYLLPQDLYIVVRAECVSEPVSLQASLTDSFPRRADIDIPPVGDFSQSFPDVADLAKHLKGLSLGDLQTFFHNEMNKSGETIELPGVKLPAEDVTSWGIVILIMLEGYFFVVFREFSYRVRLDDKAWNVPWIGISSDNISSAALSPRFWRCSPQ